MTAAATPTSPESTTPALLQAARTLATDLLAPGAATVDATTVPRSHLDALGRAGLLGLMAPAEVGGSAVAPQLFRRIQQVLAGADCATWFVSAQHHGPVRLLAASSAPVRAELLPALARGEQLAGIAFAHLRRFPERPVSADRTEGGWRFSGTAPWYTGWGINDVCVLGGATATGEVVFGVVPARPQPGLAASEPMRMAAMTATSTVRLHLDGLVVPDSHVVVRLPIAEWQRDDRRQTVNPNPAVFGLAEEAVRLLGQRSAEAELAAGVAAAGRLRSRLRELAEAADRLLDEVPPDEAHDERLAVRAEAQKLLLDATSALVAASGGRSMLASDPAGRLAREAAFLLVQAQTRPAREALLRQWAD